MAQHAEELYRYAYRLTGEAAGAEDLVQETYFHGWRGLRGLRDPARARAWLYAILRRRWSRTLRDRSRRPRLVGGDLSANVPAPPLAGREWDEPDLSERLREALGSLDPRLKDAFLTVFLQGLSCQEAADLLGLPRGTVLSRLHRARQALRVHLRAAWSEDEPGREPPARRASEAPPA